MEAEKLITPETQEDAKLLKDVQRDLFITWTAFMSIFAVDAALFLSDKSLSLNYGTPVVAISFVVAGFLTAFEGLRVAYASHVTKKQKTGSA